MEFRCYSDWNELPESANALLVKGEKKSMFFSRPWFKNLFSRSLHDNHIMILACVVEGDDILAILPLMKSTDLCWQSLSNYYTSLYSLILADRDQQAVLACLARGLNQLPLKSLQLVPVADDDPQLHSLRLEMENCGFECYRNFRFYNWVHRLQGASFDSYMAARPAQVRSTIARKKRKLEREHGYTIRLFTDDNLQQAMADYNTLYRASWQANEALAGFVEGLVNRLSKPGWLRFAILYVDAQPIAGQIWFVAHSKASIFRLAYDEAWKRYSPGSVLTAYLMEYVIDTDKVEEIDFLTGNERYKQDWMSERRERWSLTFVKRQEPRSRLSLLLESLKGLLYKSRSDN